LNIDLIFKLLFENFDLILHKDFVTEKIKIAANRFFSESNLT